jgi:hypothetical protein
VVSDYAFGRRKRRTVALLPLARIDGTYAPGSDPLDHRGHGAGSIADHDMDLLDARAEQAPNRALDKRYTADAQERL